MQLLEKSHESIPNLGCSKGKKDKKGFPLSAII